MSATDTKVQKLKSEVSAGLTDLGHRIETELAKDPNFFGGGSFELWVKDGVVVSTKVSLDITKKP